MCDDYYLCKVLGCEQGKRYQAYPGYDTFVIAFEKKMFCGVAKMLNVLCYQLQEPNYIEKG